MKIVIAPDSFKESMTAKEVANAIEKGVKKAASTINTVKVPLADGGEGTVQALVNYMNGKIITHTVTGPLGEKVEAHYGLIGENSAVIEIATAAGLDLVPDEKRDPLQTTTYGVGELIIHALNKGVRHFIIGLGGSSTNDGGIGMAQALGVKVLTKTNEPVSYGGKGLGEVAHIVMDGMDERLKDCLFEVACDVENPLTGHIGASFVYGPQKGANNRTVRILDQYMENYATVIDKDLQKDVKNIQGAGAAGGLGAAFVAFLNGELKRGIDIVIKLTNLEAEIRDADFVITGEGKVDEQTVYGKTINGVATIAKKHRVPVIVLTGANQIKEMKDMEIAAIYSIVDEPMSLQSAIDNGEQLTEKAAEMIVRLLLINE